MSRHLPDFYQKDEDLMTDQEKAAIHAALEAAKRRWNAMTIEERAELWRAPVQEVESL